ncbi:MAG: response regulator [Nitrospiraceae bacterium]|nr:response regulator [Nitrospiraceae bacterium]
MKKKIMIVEDEALGVLGLLDMIETWGYEGCGSAYSGETAIRLADDSGPDLIIMDVRIKGDMNGLEAARRIRAKKFVPIIFLSGYLREGVREELGFSEAVEFLNKPVDHDALKETIEKIMGGAA